MNATRFREASSDDAAALGAVHFASWRETYADLLPDALLNNPSARERSVMWGAILDEPTSVSGTAIFVAENAGEVIGFGACGRQRDAVLKQRGFAGEVGAIYIRKAYQRAGVGHSLMSAMARSLSSQDLRAASLWVLRENLAARTFYERLGGSLAGEKAEEHSGETLTEVAYGWRDLSLLVA